MPVIRRTPPNPSGPSPAFNPADLLSIEELASRLKQTEPWVREKVRKRCPSPIPVHNLGRHLLFYWPDVCEWIRDSPRPVYVRHVRRKKKAA